MADMNPNDRKIYLYALKYIFMPIQWALSDVNFAYEVIADCFAFCTLAFMRPSPEVIKLFSCSTQLIMNFQPAHINLNVKK